LVIVGKADHEDKYSRGLKEKAKNNKNIVLTGFLAGKPLQELYSHAGLFVLPS
jgi:glycosyltransferase involved in cell wall biosynthesis